MSIYDLKPRFQALLRPSVARLHAHGVTANQVTLAACIGSLICGSLLCLVGPASTWFIAVPIWMFLRMALNAIDGMLAREYGQASPLGAYLNELCDVVSDAALYLPFAFIAPFDPFWTGLVIFTAVLTEFTGVLGPTVGASRRYDGPMGKSDRAFVFGALGLSVGLWGPLPAWFGLVMPAVALACLLTCVNRARAVLTAGSKKPS